MIKNHRTASIAACVVTALVVLALAVGVFTHAPRRKRTVGHPARNIDVSGRGPPYHGQPLRQWIIKLKQGNIHEQAEAQEALRALGRKAVPYLVHELEREDSGLQGQAYAASALGEIGPQASDAIPALLRMTNTNLTLQSF